MTNALDTLTVLLPGYRPDRPGLFLVRPPRRLRREYRPLAYAMVVVFVGLCLYLAVGWRTTLTIAAGLAGGALNSMAAGGGVITLLALLVIGLPPQVAVATSQLVIPFSFLGGLPQAWRARAEYKALVPALATAAIGTGVGVVLVTVVDAHTFKMITPGLMACAAVLLLIQPRMQRLIDERHARRHPDLPAELRPDRVTITRRRQLTLGAVLFGVALYAGAFGGGVAVAVLLAFAFLTPWPWHQANVIKNAACLIMSIVGGVVFAFTGLAAISSAEP